MDTVLFFLASRLSFLLVSALSLTYRVRHLNPEARQKAAGLRVGGGFLLACWHEHILGTLISQKGWKYTTLASHSRAGRVIGYICQKFGYRMLWGSQNRGGRDKGGMRAIKGLLTSVREGGATAVTVDGSIGPRRVVKSGILDVARRTGASIVPFAVAADKKWLLPTWDSFQLPKPFANLVVSYGDPLMIDPMSRRADIELWQKKLAELINAEEVKAREALEDL